MHYALVVLMVWSGTILFIETFGWKIAIDVCPKNFLIYRKLRGITVTVAIPP